MPAERPAISLLWDPARDPCPARVYRLAGGALVTDAVLALPLLVDDVEGGADPPRHRHEAGAAGSGTRVYIGEGCFAGKTWRVRCERQEAGYFISADNRSGFLVAAGGREITRVIGSDTGFDREVLMGPVITLSLALQGVFILHASAVRIGDAALGFAGRSGAGKSTLAGYLEASVPGAERLTDDMTPVIMHKGAPHLVTDFPQPKLALAGPGADHDGEPARLDGLIWLEPGSADGAPAGISSLGPADILQRLVNSTAGARLFGRELLEHHLAFCSRCAERVDGYRSDFPLEPGSLASVRAFLAG